MNNDTASPFNEKWEIDIRINEKTGEKKFHFRRFINGIIDESYAPASQNQASVWASAIICGLQPPARLICLDKPIEQTRSAQGQQHVALLSKIQDLQNLKQRLDYVLVDLRSVLEQ